MRFVVEIKRPITQGLQGLLEPLHRCPVQPEFLLVKIQRIMRVTKVQAVLDQHDSGWREFQPRVVKVKLIGKNNQIQCSTR